jgi:group II intron reverse transcriptase/maturase
VKSSKGAAGIDGQTIEDFEQNREENLTALARELREKEYRPQPVKRVEIPKPAGGTRKLGIPAVRDRVVQQTLLSILQPIFDPEFHPSSYGYRPKRSCHQAIAKATMFIREGGLQWVVDMDLSKCFDTLDHELIIQGIRKRITDGSILNLIRLFLESGVMTDEGWQASTVGSPQGGVISPLIANIYLDAFDQFMKSRNHRIVRYADDILILTRSKSAAENARKQASAYLEGELKLTVNQKKTHIVHSGDGVKFLGVVIHTGYTRIQEDKVKGLKGKVKKITRRNSPVNLEKVIEDLNPVIRGFANYFRIANCKGVFEALMKWIRRRLRAKQLSLWKKPKRLHRRLRQLGYKGEFQFIKMRSWRNAASPLSSFSMPNSVLSKQGLFDMASVKTGISVSI